jgi:hypothetical protein
MACIAVRSGSSIPTRFGSKHDKDGTKGKIVLVLVLVLLILVLAMVEPDMYVGGKFNVEHGELK